jgi:uncharacterized protein (TIGR02284 family)
MDNDRIIGTLNDLIETCKDGQEGFKEAADNVKAPDLKTFFNQVAQERGVCVSELQADVRRLGGNPDKTGSAAGALHRTWMNIKGTLTGKDDHAILSECERGEDSAVEAYTDALKKGLPANVLAIVERQFQSIKQTHDRVKQMRDAKKAATTRP